MFSNLALHWFHLCLLALILLLPLSLIIKRTITKKSRLPPSPPKLPFIGNLHQLGSLPHRSLQSLSDKYGPLMLLQLGQLPTLVVSSPEFAKEIMRTHDTIFASRPSIKVARILLCGCKDLTFAPYGEHWRQLRRLCVIHLLNPKMVQSFKFIREEEVTSMINKITKTCSLSSSSLERVVNLREVISSLVTNLLCRVVIGKSFRGDGKHNIFRELVDEGISLFAKFFVEDYFPSLGWLDVFSGFEPKVKRLLKAWEVVLDEVIDEHAKLVGDKDDLSESSDFVDVLLHLQKDSGTGLNLDRELIRMIILDMVGAGTDTTLITLEWAMAELVHNSQVMRKLKEEMREIINKEDLIREDDLSKMSYLKAVVKEVLRMHPPAPLLLPRESTANCTIQGYEISSQTRVIVNAWAIGRDPKFWDAPEEFRPERFLSGTVDFKGNDFHYIPFGAGRRVCPGMQFAVTTLEIALANLVHQFDWKLPDGMEAKDLDMTESPGLTTSRKQKLLLVANQETFLS